MCEIENEGDNFYLSEAKKGRDLTYIMILYIATTKDILYNDQLTDTEKVEMLKIYRNDLDFARDYIKNQKEKVI